METTLIIGFVILTVILWTWAILDIIKSKFKSPTMNIIWLLGVLFFPVLGSIFYFQLRKKFVTKEKRKFQPNFNRTELKTTK
ncbi:PLDc N-terminal domain-containing protein [Psychroserpens damuponensis]|uniref:PLDc N-terminal domain-containing protein n=1 Tax=Psychroserpens damuponensis TaxID=943936 RepID=UPI0005903E4D|nr:PLD nuclease N-terminal domain-containing protein [Psychroserpens damuponensis]